MFYSHEVLTSRKYGVATVWLVATLGSKSHSKKINRKAILEVDVPKACRTILDPVAPMALRLQGNLLYGVSRVYMQQCGYVLSDAQAAYSNMYLVLRAMKNADLAPEARKARPDQLILQDDPSFLPEFTLPPLELLTELSLGLGPEPLLRNGDSQALASFSSQQDPSTPGGLVGGLIIPSSSSVGAGEFVIQGDNGPGSLGGPSGMLGGEGRDEPMPDADFIIDEDGMLIDITEANVISGTPAMPREITMPGDVEASARVRQEHEEGISARAEQFGDHMEFDLPVFGDDIPHSEGFPTVASQELGENPAEVVESSSTIIAANRRKKRTAHVLPIDTTMELRNKDLADWNSNYLENMHIATRGKHQQMLIRKAKKNAEYWVWGAGIGGIGAKLPSTSGPTPFDKFMGDSFFELLTGISRGKAGTKRDRDSGIDDVTQEGSRRVRQKADELMDQIGRGGEDEALFFPGGDEVEFPRDEPLALDDQQMFSAMPWNITASIRGSSAVPRSGRAGAPSSQTGPHARRGSRMISASPLHGRGQSGGLETLEGFQGEDELSQLDIDDFGFAGPGFSSDMPVGAFVEPNVQVREALSAEGDNFLHFIGDAIDRKRGRIQEDLGPMSDNPQIKDYSDGTEVLFEELLLPVENSKVVAAQALMMTLALGTKGLLSVRQDGEFGEIGMSLTTKAKVTRNEAHIEEISEDNDANQEDLAVDGQFEEQFAAGGQELDKETDLEGNSLYGD